MAALAACHPTPALCKAKSKSDPDAPTWWEVMTGPHTVEFRESMEKEVLSLEKRKTWSVIPRSKAGEQQVAPGTWAFKHKRKPDGAFRKFKSWCCV